MRIVYNLREQDWQTTKSLGILHVSMRLLAGLAQHPAVERLDVLANRSLQPALSRLDLPSRVQLHFTSAPPPRRWSRLLWDHWSLTRTTHRLAPDWLLLPKGFFPLFSPPRCRVSAFVHDTIFEFYRRQPTQPFPRGELTLFTAMLRGTARAAAVVATNSHFTADRFRAVFRPRGDVVRIGAPVMIVSPPPGSASPSAASLLVPTSSWPHKLTAQAIPWLSRWTAARKFAGSVHGFGSLPADVEWPRSPRWQHHGRIAPQALEALQTPDALLVYFSAYEGYGLPPVEALAAGRRAIASDLPPLRETLPPALLFPNDSYEAFARTLDHTIATPPPRPLLLDTATDSAARWVSTLQARS